MWINKVGIYGEILNLAGNRLPGMYNGQMQLVGIDSRLKVLVTELLNLNQFWKYQHVMLWNYFSKVTGSRFLSILLKFKHIVQKIK